MDASGFQAYALASATLSVHLVLLALWTGQGERI
jgi:hypothetical protein